MQITAAFETHNGYSGKSSWEASISCATHADIGCLGARLTAERLKNAHQST